MSRPAILVLRGAVADAASSTVRTDEVRDALAAIGRDLPPRADVRPLEHFWRAAGETQPAVRRTWIMAVMAAIEALVAMSEPIAAE